MSIWTRLDRILKAISLRLTLDEVAIKCSLQNERVTAGELVMDELLR